MVVISGLSISALGNPLWFSDTWKKSFKLVIAYWEQARREFNQESVRRTAHVQRKRRCVFGQNSGHLKFQVNNQQVRVRF